MRKNILFATISLLTFFSTTNALSQTTKDDLRKNEIDKTYWDVISKTVKEGDFEGYVATCHKNSIEVNTAWNNNTSYPMAIALDGWKQGFIDTKQGKIFENILFRFSKRIGDETTAHETGIFYTTIHDREGKLINEFIAHFESTLTKQGDKWVCLMEYQKAEATKEQWDALK